MVIKSDTENSESDAGFSDHDDIIKLVPDTVPVLEHVANKVVTPVKSNGASIDQRSALTEKPEAVKPVETVEITPLANNGDKIVPDTSSDAAVTQALIPFT